MRLCRVAKVRAFDGPMTEAAVKTTRRWIARFFDQR
jgi:hypothetical protein